MIHYFLPVSLSLLLAVFSLIGPVRDAGASRFDAQAKFWKKRFSITRWEEKGGHG
jgi:hypothetical protein